MTETLDQNLDDITPLNDKRTINAWALFDWANSSYALTISVAIFPAYYTASTFKEVNIFGHTLENSALYAYAISLTYLILLLVSPLMAGIADYGGRKKFFMKMFTIIGGLACIGLYFFKPMEMGETVKQSNQFLYIGTGCFMLATMGFAGSLVFYNSYLPEIASEDQYDKVSAKGFSYGYVGSVILLLLNLLVIMKPDLFGIKSTEVATRIAFVMVGVWWMAFAIIPFRRLPKDSKEKIDNTIFKKGYGEIKKVWAQLKQMPHATRFLTSFLFYSAGAQTVLYLATIFATEELKFELPEMIAVILILQVVGILGAYLFAWISDTRGNKLSLMITLVIWAGICVGAYLLNTKLQFYFIAAFVGMVMGGVQSLSRATYSKMLPVDTEDTASFFSFYDVLEKASIILGTFIFGFVNHLTGDMRMSVLVLGGFFIVAIAIFSGVKVIRPNLVKA